MSASRPEESRNVSKGSDGISGPDRRAVNTQRYKQQDAYKEGRENRVFTWVLTNLRNPRRVGFGPAGVTLLKNIQND